MQKYIVLFNVSCFKAARHTICNNTAKKVVFRKMEIFNYSHIESDKSFTCDLCNKGDLTKQGLKTHKTRMHKGHVPNSTSASLCEKPSLENKKSNIEACIKARGSEYMSIKTDYSDYQEKLKNRSDSKEYPDIFKVHAFSQPGFRRFKKKKKEQLEKAEDDIKRMICNTRFPTFGFWKFITKIFYKDLRSLSDKNKFNWELFQLGNVYMVNYIEQVQGFRQLVEASYIFLIELLNLQNISSDNYSQSEWDSNHLFEQLTLKKLRSELYCDITIGSWYESNKASPLEDRIKKNIDDKYTTLEVKEEIFKQYEEYVKIVVKTINDLKTQYIVEFRDTLIGLQDKLFHHQKLLSSAGILESLNEPKFAEGNQNREKNETKEENEDEIVTLSPVFINSNEDEIVLSGDEVANNATQKEQKQQRTRFGIDISTVPRDCLIGQEWLNDSVINSSIQMISELDPNVIIYDTYFHTTLVTRGFEFVSKVYKANNLFTKRSILIPIHNRSKTKGHWYLANFSFEYNQLSLLDPYNFPNAPTEEERREKLKNKENESMQILKKLVKKYFRPLFTLNNKSFPHLTLKVLLPPDIPAQNDTWNCGPFMLAFIKSIVTKRHFDFDNDDMPSFREIIIEEMSTGSVTTRIKQDDDIDEIEDETESSDVIDEVGFESDYNYCLICNLQFSTVDDLRAHQSVHNEQTERCDERGENYLKGEQISNHTEEHDMVLIKTCDMCEETFNNNKDLQSHVSSHAGPSSFSCPFKLCNYKTIIQNDLQEHVNICHPESKKGSVNVNPALTEKMVNEPLIKRKYLLQQLVTFEEKEEYDENNDNVDQCEAGNNDKVENGVFTYSINNPAINENHCVSEAIKEEQDDMNKPIEDVIEDSHLVQGLMNENVLKDVTNNLTINDAISLKDFMDEKVENPSEGIRNVHENVKRKFQPNILDESVSYKKLKIQKDDTQFVQKEDKKDVDKIEQKPIVKDKSEKTYSTQLKVFGKQMMSIHLNKNEWKRLTVYQMKVLTQTMSGMINFKNRQVFDNHTFRANPTITKLFMQEYKKYIHDISFNLCGVNFDRNIDDGEKKKIFKQILRPENIHKKLNKRTGRIEYNFIQMTGQKFETFVTMFC